MKLLVNFCFGISAYKHKSSGWATKIKIFWSALLSVCRLKKIHLTKHKTIQYRHMAHIVMYNAYRYTQTHTVVSESMLAIHSSANTVQ